MKLDEGDDIVDVQICSEADDVLLTTAKGQCIRFPVTRTVRVFEGRNSTGVRGIKLAKDDRVISMAILRHFEATPGRARRLSEAVRRHPARRDRRGHRARGADRRGARRPRATSRSRRSATPRWEPPSSSC